MQLSKKETKDLITYWSSKIKPGLMGCYAGTNKPLKLCSKIRTKTGFKISFINQSFASQEKQDVWVKEDKKHAAKVNDAKKKLTFVD